MANQYSTVLSMIGTLPSTMPASDGQRILAYDLYDDMYWNVPDTYKLVQRGTDASPIYVPNAKTIIEATNRFLCKDWNYVVDPKVGTPEDQSTLSLLMMSLFAREQMYTKFASQKRACLIKGDAIWHVTADPNKEPGKRLSVYEVDPGTYFPITDPANEAKIIGCYIVEQVDTGDNKTVARRQAYRKDPVTGLVSYELAYFESSNWDDRPNSGQELKTATGPTDGAPPVPMTDFDARITSIPVYHVKNNRTSTDPFGSSETRGLERIFAAVNQAISDEELALALMGIGLYTTTSGPPVDDDGNETNWRIAPGYVAEIDEDTAFDKVDGITSVQPVQDHVAYLEKSARAASGTPDIAVGDVDVSTAESGIALAFKMGPILAKNAEKEQEILGVMDHMLYDLCTMWFPVYEDFSGAAIASSVVGDPLPIDRAAFLAEIVLLLSNNIISVGYAQQLISERLGYEFPTEMLADIVQEQTALAAARNTDPFMERVDRELSDDTGA